MENMHTDVRVERVNPLKSGIFRTLVITSKLELQEFVHISVFFFTAMQLKNKECVCLSVF